MPDGADVSLTLRNAATRFVLIPVIEWVNTLVRVYQVFWDFQTSRTHNVSFIYYEQEI